MRIDGERCLHGGACRLVAPEIDDPDRIAITAATLDAMAACPSGALTWVEDEPAEDAVDAVDTAVVTGTADGEPTPSAADDPTARR